MKKYLPIQYNESKEVTAFKEMNTQLLVQGLLLFNYVYILKSYSSFTHYVYEHHLCYLSLF